MPKTKFRTSAILVFAGTIMFGVPLAALAETSSTNMPAQASDGSVSLSSAQEAAGKKFDLVDAEHTGKIDEKTAEAKQAGPMFKAIHEMDKTDAHLAIDRKEYMAGVDAAFQEADGNHDGNLSPKELETPAGKRFMTLIE